MTPQEREVLAHFGRSKTAIDPALTGLLGGAGGAYAGDVLASFLRQRYGISPRLEKPIQALTAGAGTLLGRQLGVPSNRQVPAGAPYALDPTDQDIPDWALQGARMLKNSAVDFLRDGKISRHDRWYDPIASEVPGAAFVEGGRGGGGLRGALRGGLSSAAGGVAGAGAGLLAGKGLAALLGKDPQVPGIRMNLSEILSGLGGTIGATSGFRHGVG